ncbi:sugar transferase [Dictyobacter kobayashii]|uniref:Bacterial sugar transferase domain-containing protein n=1 Tax=Dictyobacter kobayashii TaxID=2014872 RepID=A0A402AWH2_9CHLR|nr:sugar transferase [Dictyobacter kobayashii]GCE23429.1 hypothetical protein KDK_72290 [Dictyobacter kobayashii]
MNQTEKHIIVEAQTPASVPYLYGMSPDIIYVPSPFFDMVKRGIDCTAALVGLLLLSPLFLLIALRIKMHDGGPVLHFREIVGRDGKHFFALKFRTMILDADDYLQRHPDLLQLYQKNMKLTLDPRVTAVGHFLRKSSLDELPQLVNVLLGQMSLVGPRIIHPSELARYREYAHKRLSVRPGITGLWQVCGRQHSSYEERIALDMQYIDTRSLLLDLSILLKTCKVIIVHTGA